MPVNSARECAVGGGRLLFPGQEKERRTDPRAGFHPKSVPGEAEVEALPLDCSGLSHGGIPSLGAREPGSRQSRRGNCSSPIRGSKTHPLRFPTPGASPSGSLLPCPLTPRGEDGPGLPASAVPAPLRPLLGCSGGVGVVTSPCPSRGSPELIPPAALLPASEGREACQSAPQPRPASPLFESQETFFPLFSPSAASLALLQTKDEADESKAGVVCPGDLVDRRSPYLSRGQEEVGSGGTRRAADAKGT